MREWAVSAAMEASSQRMKKTQMSERTTGMDKLVSDDALENEDGVEKIVLLFAYLRSVSMCWACLMMSATQTAWTCVHR